MLQGLPEMPSAELLQALGDDRERLQMLEEAAACAVAGVSREPNKPLIKEYTLNYEAFIL